MKTLVSLNCKENAFFDRRETDFFVYVFVQNEKMKKRNDNSLIRACFFD